MRAPRSGRRIAAIGLLLAAATAGIAVWLVGSRAPKLPPPAERASTPTPEIATSPPETAAPVPFVAHRRKPPPPPYLPPYERPKGPLLVDLFRPEIRGTEIHFSRGFGRVVSAAGAVPIRDAVVGVPNEFESGREYEKFVLSLDDARVVARTDGEGRFELGESVVGSTMTVSAEGFGARILDRGWLKKTFEEPFVIELEPAARLEARVCDRVGSPRAGVEIRLIAHAFDAAPRRELRIDEIAGKLIGASRVTDENGGATFLRLPAQVSFDVELWSQQRRIVRDPSELALESGKSISKEWRLEPGTIVTGRVVDELERSVAGTTLWLTQETSVAGTSLLFTQGTAAESSSVRRRSFGDWFDRDRVERKVVTDAEGRFAIADVAPGRWWLGVAPTDRWLIHGRMVDESAIAPVAEPLEVVPDGGTVDLLLRVHRGLYIRGTAVDCDGQPVLAGVHADLESVDSSFHACATTDERTGQFAVGPLEPGDYSVTATPICMRLDQHRHRVFGKPLLPIESIEAAAGRNDLMLEFKSGAAIEAKAIRADTGDDAPATFCLASSQDPHRIQLTGFSSSASAGFDSLAPGDYALSAVTSDGFAGCATGLQLVDGQVLEGVVIRLERGAWLKLSYVGTGEDFAQVEIRAGATVYGADGIDKNSASTFVAPAGRVTVRWTAGSEHSDEEIDLEVGETRELVWPGGPPAAPTAPTTEGH